MKKALLLIATGLLIITIMVLMTGCGTSIVGRWEYANMYGLPQMVVEFRSDGTCYYSQDGYESVNTTYTVDSDGTLHMDNQTYKKTTVEEIRKMENPSGYYAFDANSLYLNVNDKELKRK